MLEDDIERSVFELNTPRLYDVRVAKFAQLLQNADLSHVVGIFCGLIDLLHFLNGNDLVCLDVDALVHGAESAAANLFEHLILTEHQLRSRLRLLVGRRAPCSGHSIRSLGRSCVLRGLLANLHLLYI